MLNFDPKQARAADAKSSVIDKAGTYTGIITRAEALRSKKNTLGLGLSFKSDDGATANYLDLYTVNAKGEELPSLRTANAIMACLGLRQAEEGQIECEKWDKQAREMQRVAVNGYPQMMGKRIGLLLQEIIEFDQDQNPRKKLEIFAVFQADTGLMASEILDKKTTPAKLAVMQAALEANPVRDKTGGASAKPKAPATHPGGASGFDDFADDLPF